MTQTFMERIQSEVLILFAPMQTLLMDWGKDLESHLSEWVLANPEKYQEALVKSYDVGCDMGHTATQASSVFRSTPFDLQHRVSEFNIKSAKLAREVTPEGCFVVGNISGSNPDFLEPYGSYTPDFVYEGYKEQIMALAEGGVDVFHISGNHQESMVIAIQAAKELTGLPVIAHNTYYKMKKGYRTLMGYEPQKASAMLAEAGADVVGAICGQWSYQDGTQIIKEMREGTDSFLGCQPDAGLPDLIDGKTVYLATPDELAAAVPDWIEAGARLVGGCCGTTLAHYAKMTAVVKETRGNPGK
jgi:5-methyltetrahydrofolate--homocysteine methyltransferase